MMAAPAAVAMRRQKIEAAMAPSAEQAAQPSPSNEIVIDMTQFTVPKDTRQAPAQPAAPSPAPAVVPPPPSDPVPEADLGWMGDDDAEMSAPSPRQSPANDREEQRYKSLQGMYNKAIKDNQALQTRLERLEAELSTRQTTPAAAAPAQGRPTLGPAPQVNIDERTRKAFADAEPFIRSIAYEVLQGALGPLLDRVASIETSLGSSLQETQQSVQRVARRTFQGTLNAAIPGLRELIASSEFRRWAAQEIPYSGGQTISQRLKLAWDAEDAQTIIKLVGDYRKASPSPAAAPADPSRFQQPQVSGAGSPNVAPDAGTQQAPMLAWSKRQEAGRRFAQGHMSQAELDKVAAIYREAAEAGRVDYNA